MTQPNIRLPALQTQLQALATNVAQACPDLRDRARRLALQFLQAQGLGHLEPERVYWHRFSETVSSTRTFSGWAHYSRPIESLTLVQLVMHRFNANDQDAQDQLDQMSGFYRQGPDGECFDETNEVRALPSALLAWLWQADLKPRLLADIQAFWRDYKSDFRRLAKAHFIGLALEERQVGTLSDDDLTFLLETLAGGARAPLTMEALDTSCNPPATTRVYLLRIGTYPTSDVLGVEAATGEHFLWIPGTASSLHKFESVRALHWWLLEQTKDAESRARFLLHFPLAAQLDTADGGLNHSIDQLFFKWGTPAGDAWVQHDEDRLSGDPFTALAERGKARMLGDAQLLLHSNAEQRKKLWLGYLGAANRVFGPMAALDWPVALAVVGAGLAETGLNIDLAVHAPTQAQREASIIGAIMAGIDTLFNSLFLWGAWASAQVPEAGSTPERAALSDPGTVVDLSELPDNAALQASESTYAPSLPTLDRYRTNVILDAFSPGSEGLAKGVYALPDGTHYIMIDGLAYRVRYCTELQAWAIVQPHNPFAFHDYLPVRLGENEQWTVLPGAGLRGGAPFDSLLRWARSSRLRITPYVRGPYDMPVEFEQRLNEIVLDPGDRTLKGYVSIGGGDGGIFHAYEAASGQLNRDADAFFTNATAQARPVLAPIDSSMPVKQVIRSIFAQSQGLVIGEVHSQTAAKQFLIEQLPRMAKEGVDTLYMEHLLTDANQTDLDTLATTGKLPPRLRSYLTTLDEGHRTDPAGRYTFLNVVQAASKSRIRVKAMDCTASYKGTVTLDETDTARQKLMNFYAHQLIHGSPPVGKWVALVGNTHADRYLDTLGLADLEGVASLRAEDVPLTDAGAIEPDPGLLFRPRGGLPILLKSDLRLRVPTGRPGVQPGRSLKSSLTSPGDYLLLRHGEGLELTHHSRNGEIIHTPVNSANGHYSLVREQWSEISGRSFPTLDGLRAALEARGLRLAS